MIQVDVILVYQRHYVQLIVIQIVHYAVNAYLVIQRHYHQPVSVVNARIVMNG